MKTRLAGLLTATLLSACGGGLYIGYDGNGNDNPPSVSLAAGSTSAAPGQAVHLTAAAADDYYVAQVSFYRIEADGSTTLLGTDSGAPYDWNATIPSGAVPGSTVSFFARATDSAGQQTSSATVGIVVQ